jgi:hypothetical protein
MWAYLAAAVQIRAVDAFDESPMSRVPKSNVESAQARVNGLRGWGGEGGGGRLRGVGPLAGRLTRVRVRVRVRVGGGMG